MEENLRNPRFEVILTVTVIVKLAPTIESCIETTAQREYWKRVNEYLKTGNEDKGVEEKIPRPTGRPY